ncbi:MAG: CBS domain-containing protein [Candidatus Marinimicrobia bacterium]|mgnify:CR=1 FL=1|jgi:CBS domain-containing protein|nr:CBS domain-containing protein [Candidatus Neomarinimicrobiota bacterium]MBT3633882.1 CBS domain-containing protein [Candidatus Neomarinimicrobiota bacterium]MBT3682868.1 CBS domain-containing protein [Candidatus Neomarinimicrobiota bacterium]MBT3759945.1 CBS domain-containing protein [Candidatus Neomarinimicrobiota bacterium]MBT3896039.1 CBS domain-containing protein [Candidatus Neomarinimicrobiota bacterium]
MFDVLSDEYQQMDEISKKSKSKISNAVSLDDPISVLSGEDFAMVSEKTSLAKIIKILQDKHLACVVVEKKNVLTGIFTERDVLNKVVGYKLDLEKEVVSDFMTPKPTKLLLEDSIAFALNKMTDGGYRHIPIVNKAKKTVAVVSMQDVINHLGEFFFDEIINLPPKPLRRQHSVEGG